MNGLVILLILIALYGAFFLFTAGLVYVLSWAIGFTFSWKLSFGIWIILIVIKHIFNTETK